MYRCRTLTFQNPFLKGIYIKSYSGSYENLRYIELVDFGRSGKAHAKLRMRAIFRAGEAWQARGSGLWGARGLGCWGLGEEGRGVYVILKFGVLGL